MKNQLTKITLDTSTNEMSITLNDKGRVTASFGFTPDFWKRWTVITKTPRKGGFLMIRNGDAEVKLANKITNIEQITITKNKKK